MATPLTAQDPACLYRHLPDVYSDDRESDNYKILSAVASETKAHKTVNEDMRDDWFADTADGSGLDRKAANFSIPRPPGMSDTIFRNLVQVLAGLRRGTLGSIRAVWDAATGIISADVEDKQTDTDKALGLGIPSFEVWICVPASGNLYGLAWAGYDTHIDGSPEESGVGGPILNDTGLAGGRYNDHAWAPVDIYTQRLLDMVRPAGVKIVYKEQAS